MPRRVLHLWALALALGAHGPQQVRASEAERAFQCPPQSRGDDAMGVPLAGDAFLPVFATPAPETDEASTIKQAIIVVHGAAEVYFEDVVKAVQRQKENQSTVVIAIALPDKACSLKDWAPQRHSALNGGYRAPIWNISGDQWQFGGLSEHQPDHDGVSSFAALDSLLAWTQKEYPSLERLTVAGFSSGAALALRWAALSQEGTDGRTALRGLPLRIVVVSPPTLLYLSPERPAASCRGTGETGPEHLCSEFGTPSGELKGQAACGWEWDDYGLGLGGLQKAGGATGSVRRVASDYLHEALDISDTEVAAVIRSRFETKDIRFLFGAKETEPCDRGSCPDSCAAMLEGSNRLQRGLNFMSHLKAVLPSYEPKCGIYQDATPFLSHNFTNWVLPLCEEKQVSDIKHGRYSYKKDVWKRVSKRGQDFVKALLIVNPNHRLTPDQALAHPWISERENMKPEMLDQGIVDALCAFGQASAFRRACMSMMAWSLTVEERAKVSDAFIEMDTSKTGTITLSEFKEVLEKKFHLEDEHIKEVFKSLDVNQTDEIHYSEFLAAMVSTRLALHDNLLRQTFKRFDVDNSGYITADNLRVVLGETFEGQEVEKIMLEADLKHDGRISYDEWIDYLKNGNIATENHQDVAARVIDRQLKNGEQQTVGVLGMRLRISHSGKSVLQKLSPAKPKDSGQAKARCACTTM
mmetsp:Transcript_179105/g.568247  ORF Transcript_179105/g.568247 Transcript_179105/m.568247 type:complete len:695 (-) Transcript_179105:110-2194(-)